MSRLAVALLATAVVAMCTNGSERAGEDEVRALLNQVAATAPEEMAQGKRLFEERWVR